MSKGSIIDTEDVVTEIMDANERADNKNCEVKIGELLEITKKRTIKGMEVGAVIGAIDGGIKGGIAGAATGFCCRWRWSNTWSNIRRYSRSCNRSLHKNC